jgi:hypothetical protein
MKRILLLTGVITLIATSGCVVSDGRRHEHFEHHDEVIVTHPDVVVRPPEIIVH